jgi:putative glycosyltransferase (TIGR04372 family)
MNFFRQQIIDILKGGIPVFWRKVRGFPGWFVANKVGPKRSYYLYKAAATLKPDSAKAHVLLIESMIALGHFDEAFTAWEKVFKRWPDWTEGRARVQSAFYYAGQAQTEKAILQKVLDTYNEFARVHQLEKLGLRLLSEFPTGIGHMALLDNYAKMSILGRRSKAKPILLVRPGVANQAYLDYFREYLPIQISDPVAFSLLSPLAKYLEDHVTAVLDASGKQIYDPYTVEASIQSRWEAEGRGPLLTLKDEDQKRGQECLERLGVPAGAWFAAVHVRGGREKERSARDADITTYRLAMEEIVARGGWVIRMGDQSMEPLHPMPHVVDYALSDLRRDWMDVFLWARCRFFIGCLSGPLMVPFTFGVPGVIANWSSLATRLWFKQDIYIFKLHWSVAEARYLSIAEVSSSALASAESSKYLKEKGIKLIDNTPEEIRDLVVEMMDRLDGKLNYTEEDERMQKKFNQVSISNSNGENSRAGRDFLRKWANLL